MLTFKDLTTSGRQGDRILDLTPSKPRSKVVELSDFTNGWILGELQSSLAQTRARHQSCNTVFCPTPYGQNTKPLAAE
jgi:hypothetical protein